MSSRSINRLVATQLVTGLEKLDSSESAVLQSFDVEALKALLRSAKERVPLGEFVSTLPGDWYDSTGFGLRLAERMPLETWDVFGYAVKSSATLGDACVRAGRFIELLCDGVELSLLVEGPKTVLTYRSIAPELSRADVTEFILGAIASGARQITGAALVATEVRFNHNAPSDPGAHERFFGCPVLFRRPHNSILFPSEMLHMPIQGKDAHLCALLDRQAQQLLESLPRSSTLTRRVQEIMSRELQGGSPSVDRVAAELGMHARTLGRRLRAEGTSFQQLLDELRHELADRYLGEPGLSIGEVAFLLGYSDPSAFNKAFRRWTGTAPHEYRRHVSSHPPAMASGDD